MPILRLSKDKKEDLKMFISIAIFTWLIIGFCFGFFMALESKECPKYNIASYLNPAYLITCEVWKPRWEK